MERLGASCPTGALEEINGGRVVSTPLALRATASLMTSVAQLSVIPYLDVECLSGRFIATLCFHDGDWRMWIAAGARGEMLIETRAVPAEACYFARVPEAPTDLLFPFLDFLAQRACCSDNGRAFNGVVDDVFNLSGSLAKLAFLARSSKDVGHGLARMATSEVEYIVFVCRSLFDLLQEVLSNVWEQVTLVDPTVRKQKLKDSFADMLVYKGEPSDAAAIAARFGLPLAIAVCYVDARPVFDGLRQLRDKLVHLGSQIPHIFVCDDAFMITRGSNPFPGEFHWDPTECGPNDLVPLVPVIETVIHRVLAVCDEFAAAWSEVISMPPPVCPGLHLYARGYFSRELTEALASGTRRSGVSIGTS